MKYSPAAVTKALGVLIESMRMSTKSAAPRSSAPHTARYAPTIQRMRRLDSAISAVVAGASKVGTAGGGCIAQLLAAQLPLAQVKPPSTPRASLRGRKTPQRRQRTIGSAICLAAGDARARLR